MMNQEPISVVCVGAGPRGRGLARSFHALGVLGGVLDTDPDASSDASMSLPGVRSLGSLQEALSDSGIRAVAIAAATASQGELVRASLEAGKDVLVEEPFCFDVHEGRVLVDLARERGRLLMIGHPLWYHPAVLTLRSLMESGELGAIQCVYSHRLESGESGPEEGDPPALARQDMSVVMGLIGESPSSVRTVGTSHVHATYIGFAGDVEGQVFVSWLHPLREQRLVVVGDRCTAMFDDTLPLEQALVVLPNASDGQPGMPAVGRATGRTVSFGADDPLRNQCGHFLECIRSRARPRTDGSKALRVLEVLAEARRHPDSSGRKADGERLVETGARGIAGVHESAVVDEGVEIGTGTRIWHFSHVLSGSKIGERCRIGQNVVIGPEVLVGDNVKIQNNVSVYQGVTLEDDVFCGPSVVFTNVYNPRSAVPRMHELRPTLVRKGASLGANATILCGVTIGEYAFVGAGAVVLKDVPDHALVVGNPARQVGWVCDCGERIHFEEEVDGKGGQAGHCEVCSMRFLLTEGKVQRGGGA